jgi:hypothetical protein
MKSNLLENLIGKTVVFSFTDSTWKIGKLIEFDSNFVVFDNVQSIYQTNFEKKEIIVYGDDELTEGIPVNGIYVNIKEISTINHQTYESFKIVTKPKIIENPNRNHRSLFKFFKKDN